MDDRALLDRLAQGIREPEDVMEGLMRRRDVRRRNARVRAGAVGFLVVAVVAALLIGTIDRPAPVPAATPTAPGVVTFRFGSGPAAMYVSGSRIEGEMDVAPANSGVFYVFDPDRTAEVPAGGRIVVETTGIDDVDGWVDVCCDMSEPPPHLYELDLANSASMPGEPGTYLVEFHVWWPHEVGGLMTFLFPVRVVEPETP
jgi:hypothetical protein